MEAGDESENENNDEDLEIQDEINKIKEKQSNDAKEFLEDTLKMVQKDESVQKRDEDNLFIADELEQMFSKVSSKH